MSDPDDSVLKKSSLPRLKQGVSSILYPSKLNNTPDKNSHNETDTVFSLQHSAKKLFRNWMRPSKSVTLPEDAEPSVFDRKDTDSLFEIGSSGACSSSSVLSGDESKNLNQSHSGVTLSVPLKKLEKRNVGKLIPGCMYKQEVHGPGAVAILVVGWHPVKGPVIEYVYPSEFGESSTNNRNTKYEFLSYITQSVWGRRMGSWRDDVKSILPFVPRVALPEGSKKSGYVFFLLPAISGNIIFGISCICNTAGHLNNNSTSGFKSDMRSVCLLSQAPFWGLLRCRLHPIAVAYCEQKDMSDISLLGSAYEQISSNDILDKLEYDDMCLDLEGNFVPIVFKFKMKQILQILKAILIESRIIVYSENPAKASSSVLAFLSMIPGGLTCGFNSDGLSSCHSQWREYGWPFEIYNESTILCPYLPVQLLDELIGKKGFLVGVDSLLVTSCRNLKIDIMVNLDRCEVSTLNKMMKTSLSLTSYENKFIEKSFVKCLASIENIEMRRKIYRMVKSAGHSLYSSQIEYSGKVSSKGVNIKKDALESSLCEDFGLSTSMVNEYDPIEWLGELDSSKPSFSRKLQSKIPDNIGKFRNIVNIKPGSNRRNSFGCVVVEETDSKPPVRTISTKKHPPIQEVGDTIFNAQEHTFVQKSMFAVRTVFTDYFQHFCRKMAILAGPERNPVNLQLPETQANQITASQFNHEFIRSWIASHNGFEWIKAHRLPFVSVVTTKTPPKTGDGSFRYNNGDVYTGGFYQGMRHGFGLYVTSDGARYEGNWKQNKKEGEGVYDRPSGEMYSGGWVDDLREGQGHSYNNNERYWGQFKSDRFHGLGLYADSKGNQYEGEFAYGKFHGAGKLKLQAGDIFSGEWVRGRLQGFASCLYADGRIYAGAVRKNLPHGKEGKMTFTDGSEYEGDWYRGMRSGTGILTIPWNCSKMAESPTTKLTDSNVQHFCISDHHSHPNVLTERLTMEGKWERDMPVSGDWQIVFPNKDKYSGNATVRSIKEDLSTQQDSQTKPESPTYCILRSKAIKQCSNLQIYPQGFGVSKVHSTGETYQGEWLFGCRHGLGDWIGSNGIRYSGNWVFGLRCGFGRLEIPGEDIYEGVFRYDEFIGENGMNGNVEDKKHKTGQPCDSLIVPGLSNPITPIIFNAFLEFNPEVGPQDTNDSGDTSSEIESSGASSPRQDITLCDNTSNRKKGTLQLDSELSNNHLSPYQGDNHINDEDDIYDLPSNSFVTPPPELVRNP